MMIKRDREDDVPQTRMDMVTAIYNSIEIGTIWVTVDHSNATTYTNGAATYTNLKSGYINLSDWHRSSSFVTLEQGPLRFTGSFSRIVNVELSDRYMIAVNINGNTMTVAKKMFIRAGYTESGKRSKTITQAEVVEHAINTRLNDAEIREAAIQRVMTDPGIVEAATQRIMQEKDTRDIAATRLYGILRKDPNFIKYVVTMYASKVVNTWGRQYYNATIDGAGQFIKDTEEKISQVMHQAKSDVPTTDVPTTDVPTTDVPTTDVPTTDVPTTDVHIDIELE